MSDYYLVHHGRKGMHWGVMNGPPYPLNTAGLKKFRANAQKAVDKAATKLEKARLKVNGGVNSVARVTNRVRTHGVVKATLSARKQAKMEKKVQKKAEKIKKKLDKRESKKNDLYNLSDAELQQRINRLQMERNYRQLVAQREAELRGDKGYVKNLAKKTAQQMGEKAVREIGNMAVDNFTKRLKEAGMTDEAKRLAAIEKKTKQLKIKNDYLKAKNTRLKEKHTNKQYKAGNFNKDEKKDKDK